MDIWTCTSTLHFECVFRVLCVLKKVLTLMKQYRNTRFLTQKRSNYTEIPFSYKMAAVVVTL